MHKIICIYSSSSCTIDKAFFDVAEALGEEIARRRDALIFGGGMTGLMGATAKGVHKYGGKVIGVIPKALNVKGIVYETCDELIVTETMRERKAIMDGRSDAFIALPGGYGTLEELLEIITLKQLQYHNKPIVILNINGFYDKLLELFEEIIHKKFAKDECKRLYHVANDLTDTLEYIDNYNPHNFTDRWLTNTEG